MKKPKLLTVAQGAEELNVGRTTMFEMIRTGEIESVKIGRLRRIPDDAIDRYIARQLAAQVQLAA